MSPKITVRPATSDDVSSIARWQVAMASETEGMTLDLSTVTAGARHVFAHPEVGEYLIGCANGEAVGCLLLLREWSDWRNGTVLWIHSLYVEKAYRKHGVFKTMYESVKSRIINDPNLKGIRLYVDKTNMPALTTYTRIGMNGDHYSTFEWMKV